MKEHSAHHVKRRRPLLAGLMAFFGPVGLGQIYNGEGRKAFIFWLTWAVFVCSIGHLGVLDTFGSAAIIFVLCLAFFIFLLIDAVRAARAKKEITLKWYNRWFVYLLLIVAPVLIPRDFLRSTLVGYEAFRIPSGAMLPTLRIGDHIIVKRTFYGAHPPQRGDLVVFTREENPGVTLIKRIIGLPGDTVEIRGTQLTVNGAPYSEDYAFYEDGGANEGDFGPATIPAEHVFLLSDNRDRAKDSRFWKMPFLPIDNLKGKVLYIYFSSDDINRIGTSLVLPENRR